MRVPYETMLAEFERVLHRHLLVQHLPQHARMGREVRCPGMGEHRSRKENMELGIPVAEEKWAEVLAM